MSSQIRVILYPGSLLIVADLNNLRMRQCNNQRKDSRSKKRDNAKKQKIRHPKKMQKKRNQKQKIFPCAQKMGEMQKENAKKCKKSEKSQNVKNATKRICISTPPPCVESDVEIHTLYDSNIMIDDIGVLGLEKRHHLGGGGQKNVFPKKRTRKRINLLRALKIYGVKTGRKYAVDSLSP